MAHLIIVIGTRPEAIKMGPVIQELTCLNLRKQCTIINTGQHADLLPELLSKLNIEPDITLHHKKKWPTKASMFAQIIAALDECFSKLQEKHGHIHVCAQGDTLSVLATAQVAFLNNLPFYHVEAGLRTHIPSTPFPEEFCRKTISLCTTHHFAPTPCAAGNLMKEHVSWNNIEITGNTIIDALHQLPVAEDLQPTPHRTKVLITCHRSENLPHIHQIKQNLYNCAQNYPELEFLWVTHPNHRFQGILTAPKNLNFISPVSHSELIGLLQQTRILITDSGGLQEEAPTYDVPVIVLRASTERTEGLKMGYAKTVGTNCGLLLEAFENFYHHPPQFNQNPYGDGLAAKRISSRFEKILNPFHQIINYSATG